MMSSIPLITRRSYSSYGEYYAPPTGWQRNGPNIVTWGFVGLCAAGYGYHLYAVDHFTKTRDRSHVDIIEQNFVNSRENLQQGRWWTLTTSSFMHFTPFHFAVNMMALVGMGPSAARIFGSGGFLGLWFVSALGCGAVSQFWEQFQEQERRKKRTNVLGYQMVQDDYDPTLSTTFARSIGASGSVLGIVTALGCFNPRTLITMFPIPVPMSMRLAGLLFATYSLGAMVTGIMPGIGHAGHLGGMAFGAAYYYTILRRRLRIPRF